MENVTTIKMILATLGGIGAYLWGPWDATIFVLVAMITLDYITGVINAIMHSKLSSEIGFKGLLKKVLVLVIVAVAGLVDKVIPDANSAVRTAVCWFYIANEGLSILENAAAMGLPIPEVLRKIMLRIESKSKDGETEEPKQEEKDESDGDGVAG